jgi:Domain of unknown function (DUF1707).
MPLPRRSNTQSLKISDLDRQRVLDLIVECRAEGYLDASEQEIAETQARTAVDRQELDAVLESLPKRARDGSDKGNRRATKAEREDAIRRLEMYEMHGAISTDERDRRITRVDMSHTPNEIAELFHDLGVLDADKVARGERLASKQQRDEATRQLNIHLAEERLNVDEHRRAVEQVSSARNQVEIDAAFRGLKPPRITAIQDSTSEKAKKAGALATGAARVGTKAAIEGGRRAGRALMRFVLAIAALLIAIIVGVAGGGLAGAAACAAVAVVLFVAAIPVLIVGKSTDG